MEKSKKNKINTAVAYLRVSTEAQGKEDSFGLDAQKEKIINYCEKKQIKIKKWVIDKGVSGAAEKKPGLEKIMNEVLTSVSRSKPYDIVVVAKTDRISRDIMYYYAYKSMFKKVGLEIVSATEDFGEDTLVAPILEAFIAAIAQVERGMITDRTKGGRNVKARKGGYSGGRSPYGYDINNKMLTINDEQAAVVRIIFFMRHQGCTLQDIVSYLNNKGYTNRKGTKWTTSSVGYISNNERTYKGEYKYGCMDEWTVGQHNAIIKEHEKWDYPELADVKRYLDSHCAN